MTCEQDVFLGASVAFVVAGTVIHVTADASTSAAAGSASVAASDVIFAGPMYTVMSSSGNGLLAAASPVNVAAAAKVTTAAKVVATSSSIGAKTASSVALVAKAPTGIAAVAPFVASPQAMIAGAAGLASAAKFAAVCVIVGGGAIIGVAIVGAVGYCVIKKLSGK